MNKHFDISPHVDSVKEADAEIEKKNTEGIDKQSVGDVLAKIAGLFGLPNEKIFLDDSEGSAEDDDVSENPEENLEKLLEDYFDDLKNRSEFPDTLPDKPFSTEDLEKLSPEEVAKRREEFDDKKAELKKQWELENGRPWPKYETDVYSANGKLIRKAGSDYDAHHIQPLCMGGKNEAKNITPLHAQEHYDKQGIHSPDSPYSKIEKSLGGN